MLLVAMARQGSSIRKGRIIGLRAIAVYALAILFLSLIPQLSMISPLSPIYPVSGSTGLYTITYNPYAGIDWNTTFRLKTQLHDHSLLGGGGNEPYTVINQYAEYGFGALGISDYNYLTWPWVNWSEYINPEAQKMVAIPDEEIALSNVHFVAPFLTTEINGTLYGTNAQRAINDILAIGGVPIIAHPWLMGFSLTTADNWTGFQGIDIYNPSEAGFRQFDFQFWDHLLTDPGRAQKHIWGFAVDDSHEIAAMNRAWITVFASQKSEASVQNSIISGSFIAVVSSSAKVNSITQAGSKIIVDTNSSVVWKADGQKIVGKTDILDISTLDPGYTYVRAEIDNATVFTQPIFIDQVSRYTHFSNGFEDGFASWNNTVVQNGTIVQSTDIAHSGLFSAKIADIHSYGDRAYANKSLGVSLKHVNMRAYMDFSNLPTNGIMHAPLSLSSSDYYRSQVVRNFESNKWGILVFNPRSGAESYYWENGTSNVTVNTWYGIELEAAMSAKGFSTLWVDGTMKVNVTSVNYGGSTITSFAAGEYYTTDDLSETLTFYLDDIIVADRYIGLSS